MTAEWRSRKMFHWKWIIIICGVYWAVYSSVLFWLDCLWTWLVWLLSWEANKADAEQCDQWSSRVHWEGTQGFTKAGLTTKGTKTSVTFSCLDHGWDPKLGSIKPPNKDWSSEHQSPSHKSSLFQTSGVLIQNPPTGELLVRNQYSSWGVLWPSLYKDQWSLKSIFSWRSWKVYPHYPPQTYQVGFLCNCIRFKMG